MDPFEEPAGGPNFYLWAERTNYDINIDNDGDARPDVIFRWRFTTHHRNPDSFIYNNGPVTSLNDENLLIYQTYDLTRIKGDNAVKLLDNARVVPSHVGDASMPGYNADLFDAGVRSAGSGRRSWVGQSDDPFFLDLRVFDLLYGGDFSEAGDDTLDGFNVNTMVLEVPKSQLRGPDDGVIGVWTTASRPSIRIQGADGSIEWQGPTVQVSRLGMPLVNEVVVPIGFKDYFNGSNPRGDAAFLPKVNDPELPHLIQRCTAPCSPRFRLQRCQGRGPAVRPGAGVPHRTAGAEQAGRRRAAEMLRLNMDVAPCTADCSTLGAIDGDIAGFPNGRRLSDDIIDIALRVVMGVLIPGHDTDADGLADGVDANDASFLSEFPYVAYPHSGSDADPHAVP